MITNSYNTWVYPVPFRLTSKYGPGITIVTPPIVPLFESLQGMDVRRVRDVVDLTIAGLRQHGEYITMGELRSAFGLERNSETDGYRLDPRRVNVATNLDYNGRCDIQITYRDELQPPCDPPFLMTMKWEP